MKIIDSHVHSFFPSKHSLYKTHWTEKPNLGTLIREMKEANIVNAISITSDDAMSSPTPIFLKEHRKQKEEADLLIVGGINPLKAGKEEIYQTEKALAEKLIVGLKIYAGYTYFYPNDKIYHPFFKLAEKYSVPVIIHCGDVFQCPDLKFPPKLKYSHPFNVDEIAVDFPGVNFVIAHLGMPWIIDTTEIIYKNDNAYADLSALVLAKSSLDLKGMKHDIDFLLGYSEKPERLLYGSDWPLNNMKIYVEIIKKVVPKKHWEKVFYSNAKDLFKIKS